MTRHRFFQVDVFTDTPFAGNPLAIFPEADDLDAGQMLALSREMNLSETSFVQRSDSATKRVRFFTPTAEVPLAGVVRPTNGFAHITVEQGIEIGRPSSIEVQVAVGNGGEITEVCVGGIAFTVIQGKVNV